MISGPLNLAKPLFLAITGVPIPIDRWRHHVTYGAPIGRGQLRPKSGAKLKKLLTTLSLMDLFPLLIWLQLVSIFQV